MKKWTVTFLVRFYPLDEYDFMSWSETVEADDDEQAAVRAANKLDQRAFAEIRGIISIREGD